MRIVQFCDKNGASAQNDILCKNANITVGIQLDDEFGDIISLNSLKHSVPFQIKNSIDLITLWENEEGFKESLKSLVLNQRESVVEKSDIIALPPVTNPGKVIGIGLNYADHCKEQNRPIPKEPVVFGKFPSCVIGNGAKIPYPNGITEELDWEAELVVVIGKEVGRETNVTELNYHEFVFGYTIGLDVSARDWQAKSKNGGQILIAKSMDGFLPLGPAIVTKDDIVDPHSLNLKCHVNNCEKQNSNTDQMIFKIWDVLSWLSSFLTLNPGDIILTGSPPGSGKYQKPIPQFLKKGDTVRCTIDQIGSITNEIC